MSKLYAFKDHRTKASTQNSMASSCIFQCGEYRYRYQWDWARLFPVEISEGNVAGIACDQHGYIYLAVRVKGFPIAKFQSDGTFVRYYGQHLDVAEVHGISIDAEDNIWLVDDVDNVVYKISQADEVLLTLGTKGAASETGVDMTIKSHLKYLTIRRSAGPFNKPTKAFVGTDGTIFVSDGYANARVHSFTPEGKLLSSWGNPGNGIGEFNIVHSVFADCRGRVWVADRDNDRVQIFDEMGTVLKIIPDMLYPADICSDGNKVYVAELDGRISVFDLEFQLIAQIGYWHSPYKVHSLCVDDGGNLYLGLFNEYPVVKLERII